MTDNKQNTNINTQSTDVSTNINTNTDLLHFEQNDTCWISMDGLQTNLIEELSGDFSHQIKLACFDFDNTLVRSKSGSLFAKDANDWILCFPNVKTKLQELWQDGFQIVIFSNQMGVKTKKTSVEELIQKFTDFQKEIQVPLIVAFSTDDDYYRKPLTGMFVEVLVRIVVKTGIPGVVVATNSFYCGDAAGRPKNWRPDAKKDFSRSDLYFAHNNKLDFRVPEQVFEDMPLDANTFVTDVYDNVNWEQLDGEAKAKSIKMGENLSKNPRMVIMIGSPASGKSTYAQTFAKEYPNTVIINMDTLKTKDKCLKKAKEAIKEGQNIIVDNTNPAVATRKEYLDLVANHDPAYNTVAIWLDTPEEISRHLNYLRVHQSHGEKRRIPPVAFGVFNKKFEEPTLDEGFHIIIRKTFPLKGKSLETVREYKFDI